MINEKKYDNELAIFMDHYEIAPFEAPARASAVINAFF